MMDFGWTLDQSLNMPARSFFALAKAAREIESEKINSFLYELCDVLPLANGSSEYHKELKDFYWKRLIKDAPPPPKAPSVDMLNPEQTTAALARIFGGRR